MVDKTKTSSVSTTQKDYKGYLRIKDVLLSFHKTMNENVEMRQNLEKMTTLTP